VHGELRVDPLHHGAARVGTGDLVEAVEQHNAPAGPELPLPPTGAFSADQIRDGRPDQCGQTDLGIGHDRVGVFTQLR
jgi:hypothetical protein